MEKVQKGKLKERGIRSEDENFIIRHRIHKRRTGDEIASSARKRRTKRVPLRVKSPAEKGKAVKY